MWRRDKQPEVAVQSYMGIPNIHRYYVYGKFPRDFSLPFANIPTPKLEALQISTRISEQRSNVQSCTCKALTRENCHLRSEMRSHSTKRIYFNFKRNDRSSKMQKCRAGLLHIKKTETVTKKMSQCCFNDVRLQFFQILFSV